MIASPLAAAPVASDSDECVRCGVGLSRFNRRCVHALVCLGCEEEP